MFRKLTALPLAALLFGFGLTWAAAPPKKKTASTSSAARKAPAKSTATKAPARSYAARSRTSKSTYSRGRTRGRSPRPVAARRYRGQQAPTQERYLEIQKALAERGFLNGTPTGTWDAASTEALKKLQEEQNLPPTGKITSLSLIALGLGPKRNTLGGGAALPPSPAPAPQETPAAPEAPPQVP